MINLNIYIYHNWNNNIRLNIVQIILESANASSIPNLSLITLYTFSSFLIDSKKSIKSLKSLSYIVLSATNSIIGIAIKAYKTKFTIIWTYPKWYWFTIYVYNSFHIPIKSRHVFDVFVESLFRIIYFITWILVEFVNKYFIIRIN